MPNEKEILEALSKIKDPDLNRDIVSLGFIQNLSITNKDVSFDLNLTTPACPVKDELKADAEKAVKNLPGINNVTVNLKAEVRKTTQPVQENIQGIRNFVVVASGKGGVGKSTVAANLAVAMAQTGSKVGLLDADIYGPTIPLLMGPEASIDITKDNSIIPAEAHGIKFVSMGFMAPGDKPLIWRGPMAHQALQQTLFQSKWGELDYLFIDLPPGTGDVHLTIAQSIQVTGAIMVSTPQDVGLTISMKTYQMFKTTKVKTLGIIENMSYHICTHCGEREEIFGHGGVEKEAARIGIPFLGKIPLDQTIRECSDNGKPIVTQQSHPVSLAYKTIAGKVAQQVSIASFASPTLKIVEEPSEAN